MKKMIKTIAVVVLILTISIILISCDNEANINGIISIKLTETNEYVDTYTITFTNGETTTFTVTNGKDGAQGIQGIQGEPGKDGHTPVITIENGNWHIDGVDTGKHAQGLKGETGNGISSIIKTSTDGLVDTYTITFTNGQTTTFTVTNGKDGAQGIQGIQGMPGKDGHTPVITIENGNWYIDGVDTGKHAQGIKGETGNGISSIKLTNTEGLVDTYTITFTNGETATFTVTNGKEGAQGIQGIQGMPGKDGHTPVITIENGNWYIDGVDTGKYAQGLKGETGNGISSIEKTSTDGLVDTYTITFTNGTTTTFTVTNGKGGLDGENGLSAYEIYLKHHPEYTKSEEEWIIDLINGNLGNKKYHFIQFDDGDGNIIGSASVEHTYKVKVPTNPVKEGYDFLGWYYQGEEWKFNIYPVLEDMVLVAKWKEANYEINFETNGGSELETIFYSYGDEFQLGESFKDGYTFDGWFLTSDFKGERIKAINKQVFGNLTLYAKFEPNKYYVSLDGKNGEDFKVAEVHYNNLYSLEVPVKEGSKFVGWYYNDGLNDVQYTDENGKSIESYKHLEGISLFAKYEIQKYTISFDLKGKGEIDSVEVEYLGELNLPTDLEVNSNFLQGWYNQDYTEEYPSKIIVTSDLVLHAKWITSIGVSTYEELLAIKNDPLLNYHLLNDINCGGNLWNPITSYSGVLNGCGHKIYNITISHINNMQYGIIYNNKGTIKNLTVEGYSINISVNNVKGIVNAGVLCGLNNGTIENVNIHTGNVVIYVNYLNNKTEQDFYYSTSFGTVAGRNNGTILNSKGYGEYSITGRNEKDYSSIQTFELFIGGLVGLSSGSIINCEGQVNGPCNIWSYCSYAGTASVNTYIGGLVGISMSQVHQSVGTANIVVTMTGITDWGKRYTKFEIGGLAGRNSSMVTECVGTCSVQANDASGQFGGLVGNNLAKATIKNSHANADIYVKKNSLGERLGCGGIAGSNEGVVSSVYCYTTIKTDCSSNTGFVVGYNDYSGTVLNSFTNGKLQLKNNVNDSFHVGKNLGVITNCVVEENIELFVGANNIAYDLFATTTAYNKAKLVSKECILNKLYWSEDIWEIDEVNYPSLRWMK